jgi:hypothetical protein
MLSSQRMPVLWKAQLEIERFKRTLKAERIAMSAKTACCPKIQPAYPLLVVLFET